DRVERLAAVRALANLGRRDLQVAGVEGAPGVEDVVVAAAEQRPERTAWPEARAVVPRDPQAGARGARGYARDPLRADDEHVAERVGGDAGLTGRRPGEPDRRREAALRSGRCRRKRK